MGKSVAFKCTYNDGGRVAAGRGVGFLGFAGTCSKANMERNIREGRAWCSQPNNPCTRFLKLGAKGRMPSEPCYESTLLSKWTFGTGVFHEGPRKGEPDVPRDLEVGKLALLTTRLPDTEEDKRIVFGVMHIVDAKQDGESFWVTGDPKTALRVPEDSLLHYWNFRDGVPKWGTHLYRYVVDEEVTAFLGALYPLLKSPDLQARARKLLAVLGATPESAPPAKEQDDTEEQQRKIELNRKYGAGGEGPAHKKLKKYIYDNPDVIGLDVVGRFMEYRFGSGDRVDLAFKTKDGTFVAVEVEVEGAENTRVGTLQAIKYRTLAAVESGAAISSPKARGILVAHSIPATVKKFCKDYDVDAFEVVPA